MLELLRQEFVQRALLAGMGLAIPMGILGCFMLWRRMSFFSDAMGHAAILGVIGGLILHIHPQMAVAAIALLAAFILSRYRDSSRLPLDTWLGAVSYGGLSLGLCLMALYPSVRVNPEAILFGEILSVTWTDVLWVLAVAIGTPLLFWKIWRPVVLITMDEDWAATNNTPVYSIQMIFLTTIALVTAVGLKITGALLLPALMIFPAATASYFARSPETMVITSSLVAIVSFMSGALVSFWFDLPTGPAIVVISLLLMVIGAFVKKY
ncbi:MAG: metal ABC transporter permease [Candidatus Paracaedibacteraceae bacterium]|nr:metal ABC transporter permease [Candidatus Paracaedibacteraceae bacterium]